MWKFIYGGAGGHICGTSGRRDAPRHNRAYFTMVALDENDKPKRVPRLILETEAEKAEWEAAEKRREMRMRRKKEGF